MWQQTRFLVDDLGHVTKVVEGSLKPHLGQCLARRLVAQFGFLAEREERLFAAHLGAVSGHLQNLIDGHVRRFQFSRYLGKRAIVANVPTQMCQWDEYLA